MTQGGAFSKTSQEGATQERKSKATAEARSLSKERSGEGRCCRTPRAREADGRPHAIEREAGSGKTQNPSRARSGVH